jgi:hypothetical protein
VVKKQGGVAEFGCDLLAAFLDVGNRDPRALGHKQPCLGFPLPAGRAGDDRHFAAQSSHGFFFLCSFQRNGAGPIRNVDTT